jgi:CBS domain-containing protein
VAPLRRWSGLSTAADADRGGRRCPAAANRRPDDASYRVHAVVVDHDFGWSVVSDLDLVEALGVGADTATADRIALTPAVMVAPDETLERAAQLMSEHEVSHLVVAVPGAERPLGVLSTLDVARALAVEPGTHDAGPTS